MNKQHRILTALLVIQLVLVAVFWTTRTGTPGVKATKPLLEMDREKVVALEIEQSPESEAPKKLTLDLKEGHWRLSSHFDYPADDAKVSARARSALSKPEGGRSAEDQRRSF